MPEQVVFLGIRGKLAKRNQTVAADPFAYFGFRISPALSSRTDQRFRRPRTLKPDQEPWFQEAARGRLRGITRKRPTSVRQN